MNSLAELDQLHMEPAAKTEVVALIQSLMTQVAQDAQTITSQQVLLQSKDSELQIKNQAIDAKDFKIAALTYDLAYYKRIRFHTKSEALAPLQHDVFEETCNTDIAAIAAKVDQLQGNNSSGTVTPPKHPRAGRQPLPAHLPRIEHRHEPESYT